MQIELFSLAAARPSSRSNRAAGRTGRTGRSCPQEILLAVGGGTGAGAGTGKPEMDRDIIRRRRGQGWLDLERGLICFGWICLDMLAKGIYWLDMFVKLRELDLDGSPTNISLNIFLVGTHRGISQEPQTNLCVPLLIFGSECS